MDECSSMRPESNVRKSKTIVFNRKKRGGALKVKLNGNEMEEVESMNIYGLCLVQMEE